MNKYEVKFSKSFKKQLKKVLKQGKDIDKLLDIVDILAKKEKLDKKYRDHSLHSDKYFKNCRECHIESNWLLVYKYLENVLVLLLVGTGSHSDLLNL